MLTAFLTDFINPHALGTEAYSQHERQYVLQNLALSETPTRVVNGFFMRTHNTVHELSIAFENDDKKLFREWGSKDGRFLVGKHEDPVVFDANWHIVAAFDGQDLYAKDEATAKAIAKEAGLNTADPEASKFIERMTYDAQNGSVDTNAYEIDDEPVLLNPELYPYIDGGPEKLIADFKKSRAKLMLFIGDPGSGKSSLIRHMVSCFKNVLLGDDCSLFAPNVIAKTAEEMLNTGKNDLVVFEEIDSVISSRKNEANLLLPSFLSATSGVITMGGKLIIVSNVESTKHIDEALMRSSRCFKVVHFRKLTQEEANVAADILKVAHPTGKKEYALAEIVGGPNPGSATKIGF